MFSNEVPKCFVQNSITSSGHGFISLSLCLPCTHQIEETLFLSSVTVICPFTPPSIFASQNRVCSINWNPFKILALNFIQIYGIIRRQSAETIPLSSFLTRYIPLLNIAHQWHKEKGQTNYGRQYTCHKPRKTNKLTSPASPTKWLQWQGPPKTTVR